MDLKLSGRTALITGSSKGIGLAVAQWFAREGVHVCLVRARPKLLKKEAAAIGKATGVTARTLAADLADTARARARLQGFSGHRHSGEQCRRHSGRLDPRCRRAGLARRLGPQGVRLCRPDAALSRHNERAPPRRHHQYHRPGRRAARRHLYRRRDGQCRPDGVHARDRRHQHRISACGWSASIRARCSPIASRFWAASARQRYTATRAGGRRALPKCRMAARRHATRSPQPWCSSRPIFALIPAAPSSPSTAASPIAAACRSRLSSGAFTGSRRK